MGDEMDQIVLHIFRPGDFNRRIVLVPDIMEQNIKCNKMLWRGPSENLKYLPWDKWLTIYSVKSNSISAQ